MTPSSSIATSLPLRRATTTAFSASTCSLHHSRRPSMPTTSPRRHGTCTLSFPRTGTSVSGVGSSCYRQTSRTAFRCFRDANVNDVWCLVSCVPLDRSVRRCIIIGNDSAAGAGGGHGRNHDDDGVQSRDGTVGGGAKGVVVPPPPPPMGAAAMRRSATTTDVIKLFHHAVEQLPYMALDARQAACRDALRTFLQDDTVRANISAERRNYSSDRDDDERQALQSALARLTAERRAGNDVSRQPAASSPVKPDPLLRCIAELARGLP